MSLFIAGILSVAGSLVVPFFQVRETRVSTGHGLSLGLASPGFTVGLVVWAILAIWTLATRRSSRAGDRGVRRPQRVAPALLDACAVAIGPLVMMALADGSTRIAGGLPLMARVSFGPGLWLALAGAWLCAMGNGRRVQPGLAARRTVSALALAASAGAGIVLALSGAFSSLGMARELSSRAALVATAFAEHMAYAFLPTLLAAMIALPLGKASINKAWVEKPLFFTAAIAQTVPTLSLLGLLVLPLSALRTAVPALKAIGFSGTGWAPASIALFLYALLPLASTARAGFALVSPAAVEAATGLGMSGRQVFLKVELPLAAPALIAGFRTALAQNLGNAVLAGLIGGGGLGGVLFLGLAQAAPDLVYLGALPVAAAALAVDGSLSWAESVASRNAGQQRADELKEAVA
ncbi:MAG: ABC transporter permease subunit [Spirochaetia bacterium]|nr:ABC transporter permease subunit [Spirochaetia bacterium]